MSSKPRSFLRIFTETGPLIAVTVAVALLVGLVAPASAQFFNFPGFGNFGGPSPRQQPQRGGGGGGWFGGDVFAPFQQQAPRRQPAREDFSRAPAPEKRDVQAARNVLVLGDSMADWLAYGLEDALSETSDLGVIRKHKTVSGLIRYQPKGDPADWAAAAKGILASEKPDAIVVMLGLSDRVPLRETAADRKTPRGKTSAKDGAGDAAKSDDKAADPELSPDDAADNSDTPSIIAPEKSARGGGATEFRDERWGELYSKKIEEMIGVLKSKGVPVLWVGLPAVRGAKATSDMLYLNGLYREAAGKAGITYVDVWDGFVDEGGRFLQQGPDFEGQIRRLRSYDGVYFTKAGARKLAHYVEREITRLLAGRSAPVDLPTEPETPDANAQPGGPAPRPLVGPVMPLVLSNANSDQLMGGPGTRTASLDALAARTMVKGEALAPPAGRADDFIWPRREVGNERARAESPVAAVTPSGDSADTSAVAAAPAPPPKPKRTRPAMVQQAPPQPSWQGFFGFGQQPPPQPQRPRPARPPNAVGPSAGVPSIFGR